MDVTVKAKYIKTSPLKIKLLTDFVKGLNTFEALAQLNHCNKQSKQDLIHLIKSAIAAAKDQDLSESDLYIKSIICNQGPRLKRMNYGSKGRSIRITKRMSHIILTISERKTEKQRNKKACKQGNKKA